MWNWIAKAGQLLETGEPFAIVTVTRARGSTPREGGAKMLVTTDGKFFGTIGGGQLEREALNDARKCLAEGRSRAVSYPLCSAAGQCCGGNVELFVEIVNQESVLYLFGAGHVGQALCKTLEGTPFKVVAIDERPEWLEPLPAEITRFNKGWREFVEQARWDGQKTFVLVMTHQHDLDLQIVQTVLAKPLRYVGMIGSETKWATLSRKMEAAGITREQLARVRCPIGLDLGGKAPQEIAISVAAELLAEHYGRNPGSRER